MTPPQIFTVTFWQATVARMVSYGSSAALATWGVGAAGSFDGTWHLSIPSLGVAAAFGSGALLGFFTACIGSQIPARGGGPLAAIAALFPNPRQVFEVRLRHRTDDPAAPAPPDPPHTTTPGDSQ